MTRSSQETLGLAGRAAATGRTAGRSIAVAVAAGMATVLLSGAAFAADAPRLSALGTTTTSAGGTSGATGPSSPLCSASTLAQAKTLVESELAARVSQLNLLVSRVNEAAHVTTGDRSALSSTLTQNELPGIEGLQTKVPGDATCAEVRQDAHTMVFSYRVYLVMTPETDLVIGTDTATAVDTTLAGWETAIGNRIDAAKAKGKDVTDAEAAFADYQTQVGAVQPLLASQSATLLALTPAGYPGNAATSHQARTNLHTARTDLRAARADLLRIRTDLS